MLVKGNDVIGLKVLTLKKGRQVEDVDDIIYDPSENRVKALLVDKGGWFSDAKVIPIEKVKSIGKDAVMIDSATVIKKASELGKRVSHIAHDETYLTKTKVITEKGTQLGSISDVYFDEHTGIVKDFEVSQGFRDIQSGRKKIKVTDIITVGSDATIVRAAAEDKLEEQAQQQGVAGGIAKAKQQAPSVLERSKQALSSFGQKTSEKAQEVQDKTATYAKSVGENLQKKGNVQQASQKISEHVGRAQETVSGKMEEAKEKKVAADRNSALGKYLTKNILTVDDTVLAVRGDLVTHAVLNEAAEAGVLDQVLGNVSNNPVENTESVPIDIGGMLRPEAPEEYRMYGALGGQKGKDKKKAEKRNAKTPPQEKK